MAIGNPSRRWNCSKNKSNNNCPHLRDVDGSSRLSCVILTSFFWADPCVPTCPRVWNGLRNCDFEGTCFETFLWRSRCPSRLLRTLRCLLGNGRLITHVHPFCWENRELWSFLPCFRSNRLLLVRAWRRREGMVPSSWRFAEKSHTEKIIFLKCKNGPKDRLKGL